MDTKMLQDLIKYQAQRIESLQNELKKLQDQLNKLKEYESSTI